LFLLPLLGLKPRDIIPLSVRDPRSLTVHRLNAGPTIFLLAKASGGYDVSRHRSLATEIKICTTRCNNLMKRIAREIEASPSLLDQAIHDAARLECDDLTLRELIDIFERSDRWVEQTIANAQGAERLRLKAIADVDKEQVERTRNWLRGTDVS
jgi:hypothetical protein